ncbi:hypothetical protein X975_20501, partial [Stegodyphus mimosarum]
MFEYSAIVEGIQMFFVRKICQYCLLTHPSKCKCASSEELPFSTICSISFVKLMTESHFTVDNFIIYFCNNQQLFIY